MTQNNKIKAFTLSELIVVLILTSIVVGLAFSVLTLVQKHMGSIQQNYNQKTELNTLETALWIDFNRYPNINYNITNNVLELSSVLGSTSYKFTRTSIIKDLDTFNIELQSKVFLYKGNTIEKGTTDAIKLETSKVFQNKKLFIYKQNDATAFMN
ncbi:type II secretion system protein [Pontimicrobium sp. MEBiC01747]